jgi:tyrosyl-tRNA synthetase
MTITLAQLAVDSGLVKSKSEARRLAKQGGLRVNDVVERNADRLMTLDDLRFPEKTK